MRRILLLIALGLVVAATSNAQTGTPTPVVTAGVNNILYIGNPVTDIKWTAPMYYTYSSDLGAQFNYAEAALPPNGGEIDVYTPKNSSGTDPTYTFTTPMVFNKTVKLKCVRGGYANGSLSPPHGGPINSHTTTLLSWGGSSSVPPIQIGTPIALTTVSVSGTSGTLTCAVANCTMYAGQQIAIYNSSSSGLNYNVNTGTPAIYINAQTGANTYTLTLPVSLTATGSGGSFSIIGGALGSSIEGCQFTDASGTPAPPAFIDIDGFSNDVLLQDVVIDKPPVLATGGAIRYGKTFPVVGQKCRETVVRTAGLWGYELDNITAGFVGYGCRSLQNNSGEWVIGNLSNGLVESFDCFGCTAEAGANGGESGIVIYNAISFHWYGGYFEHAGNNTYALIIPSNAASASNVLVDGSYVLGYPCDTACGLGVPTSAFLTDFSPAQFTVNNNSIRGSYNSGGFIVNNQADARAMIEGNDANVGVTFNQYSNAATAIYCGNTINGVLQTPCGAP